MSQSYLRPRMPFDDVAWEKSEAVDDAWIAKLFKHETLFAIGQFIAKHHMGVPVELFSPVNGAFNVCLQMSFETGKSAMIRIARPGVSMFPEEKVRNEVAVMRYLQEHTAIPIPLILHWGTAKECPCNLGPFIIMEYAEHALNISAALNTPGFVLEDRPILDPNIAIDKLEHLYRQVADILLQLSSISLPSIGSLVETEEDKWEVKDRPLTFNMDSLVGLGTFPRSKLPKTTFKTSSSYFEALAEMHINHLSHQRNDAIDNAIDCTRKYIGRHLFRKLARESKLTSPEHNAGPFKLWCDDLRPTNILLNADLKIVAVIDWEFTYSAPAEFSYAPPWWLLLEQPEYWPEGLDAWADAYEPRLEVFLRALRARENDAISRGTLSSKTTRLSEHMLQSWKSGDFRISYAARKSFAFDSVFWTQLDGRFFGTQKRQRGAIGAIEDRVGYLSKEEREGMGAFVERKVKEMEDRVLAWEPEEEWVIDNSDIDEVQKE
ncbi:MAG: hypothetical protein M1819_005968 [Sarea resinae]|nr:MAG: hypothetical protein M1819_005968 [Sarea resinae]